MTYADFITLMMIFFIVLYTFTPGVEREKFNAILGAFQGSKGVLKYEQPRINPKSPSTEVKRAQNWENFYQMIKDKELSEEIQIDLMPDGVRIILGESVTFETYSAELLQEAFPILKEIARGLETYTYEQLKAVEIHGHTDNRPIVSRHGRYRSNWELGAGRAITVLKYLNNRTNFDTGIFRAMTFGEYHPRVPNTDRESLRKNRRVEIHIRYRERPQSPEEQMLEGENIPETIKDLSNEY